MFTNDKNTKIKILAVDDNPKNIQVIGSFLRDAGYSVGFAYDGQQALNILNETPDFDLILLDINMPVMNGLDTCKAIRASETLKEIPVIFLTALNDTNDILTGFDVGGQDYVCKPFNSKEILSRINTHVELKRSKDQLKKVNQWLEDKVEERTKELRKSNLELEKAYQELQVLDKSKSDFLTLITHQINTPLNGILGFIGILKDELKDSHLNEMCSYLEISANRLESFAKVGLKITELRTKKLTVEKREVHLDNLIEMSKISLAEKIKEKNISIQIEGDMLESTCDGDEGLLKFCVESILENAIKFSPKEGTIFVTINSEEDRRHFSFIDQGNGFNTKALDSLFKLFVPGSDYSDENIGLDLALVKLIMDAHKGVVTVTNHEKNGAVVTLTFPIQN